MTWQLWVRAGLALIYVAVLSSCSSNPLEREEVQPLAVRPPLSRSVFLTVTCHGDASETYGSDDEWERDLAKALREDLHASAAVWQRADDVPAAQADVKLEIKVDPRPAGAPTLSGKEAFVGFLGWSAVPLLPLWNEDVAVDPAVAVTVVRLALQEGSRRAEGDRDIAVDLPRVPTSLSQRYPFLSWPTLGSLIVPPFAYSTGDKVHLASSIATRVRLETAIKIAALLKDFETNGELLSDFRIESREGEIHVNFQADEDTGRLAFRIDRRDAPAFQEDFLSPSRDARQRLGCSVPRRGSLLCIEAQSRSSGRILPYTLLLPGEPGVEE